MLQLHRAVFSCPENVVFLERFGLSASNGHWDLQDGSGIDVWNLGTETKLTEIQWYATPADIEAIKRATAGFELFDSTIVVEEEDESYASIMWDGIIHRFSSTYYSPGSYADFSQASNAGRVCNRVNEPISTEVQHDELKLSHIAIYVADLERSKKLFKILGFHVSDEMTGRNCFLRANKEDFHHTLLIVGDASKAGQMHHLSIAANDTYSVFTRGGAISAAGFETVQGPGRHIISSATFWYFRTPLGVIELCSDEDYLTHEWVPRQIDPTTVPVNEWIVVDAPNNLAFSSHKMIEPIKGE